MADWQKIGMDVAAGGVAGAADQLVQNWDEKTAMAKVAKGELAAGKKLPLLQQVGTYLNYGLPLLSVVGIASGYVRGENATRLAVVAGQLAGRKVTHQVTTGKNSATPSAAYTEWARSGGKARTNQPEFAVTGAQAW